MSAVFSRWFIVFFVPFLATSVFSADQDTYFYAVDVEKLMLEAAMKSVEKGRVSLRCYPKDQWQDIEITKDGKIIVNEGNYKEVILASIRNDNPCTYKAFQNATQFVDMSFVRCSQEGCEPSYSIPYEQRRHFFWKNVQQKVKFWKNKAEMKHPSGLSYENPNTEVLHSSLLSSIFWQLLGRNIGQFNNPSIDRIQAKRLKPFVERSRPEIVPDQDRLLLHFKGKGILDVAEINAEMETLFEAVGEPYTEE